MALRKPLVLVSGSVKELPLSDNVDGIPVRYNRIINGDMRVDQRNNGSSVTPVSGQYIVDRFWYRATQFNKFSSQQIGTSGNAYAAGFSKALGFTSLSAYSLSSTDRFNFAHCIEGFNTADLLWGSASAQTATLSFWVYSTLTGTHSGVVKNSAGTRSYPFAYTISAANTWEKKTITIGGDTSGTWLIDNGIGVAIYWSLGVGSTLTGTSGAWASSDLYGATGTTQIVSTNSAEFFITGIQFEKGDAAYPFEFLDFSEQFIRCQRYYATTYSAYTGAVSSGSAYGAFVPLPVKMRASPTCAFSSSVAAANFPSTSGSFSYSYQNGFLYEKVANGTGGARFLDALTFDAEL